MRFFAPLVAASIWMVSAAVAGPAEDAQAVVEKWASAYSANDPDAVLKLYTPDAIFLGTVSPIIATTADARRGYFARLSGSGNKVKIGEHKLMVLSDVAVLSAGFYDFTIMRDGKPVEAPNRFTMLLVKRGSEWLIAHHHSSNKPRPPQ